MAENKTLTETGETLTAGRELDCRVAAALGWKREPYAPAFPDRYWWVDAEGQVQSVGDVPPFSTDEGAAVRALMTFPSAIVQKCLSGGFWARVYKSGTGETFDCDADTLCLAVCGAILKAKEGANDA